METPLGKGGLYRTTDGGTTCEAVNIAGSFYNVAFDSKSGAIYAADLNFRRWKPGEKNILAQRGQYGNPPRGCEVLGIRRCGIRLSARPL
jgi:hypothetical protein